MPVSPNFEVHNEEVRRVWQAYRAGRPTRVPMVLGIQPRYTMFGHEANPRGITFEQYWSDPQAMLERQLEHLEWCAFNLPQDAEMGVPEAWTVAVDFQNVYEAAALGCDIQYCAGQVPDTRPLEGVAALRALLDSGVPDPFENPFWRTVWSFHEHFSAQQAAGFEWRERPIWVSGPSGMGTDGPVTGACNVRGAMEFCLDLAEDPVFADELMAFLVESTIARIKAFRARMGYPLREKGFGFADDSIALLSSTMVVERVLPHHRRLVDAFSEGGPNSIHLCGDATRHFPLLKTALNIKSFDTGFPVDFARLRRELGPDVEILGGPSVPFLQAATPDEVRKETRRILQSGVMEGGRFVLREGNNLAPEIGVEMVSAMYEECREWGKYC